MFSGHTSHSFSYDSPEVNEVRLRHIVERNQYGSRSHRCRSYHRLRQLSARRGFLPNLAITLGIRGDLGTIEAIHCPGRDRAREETTPIVNTANDTLVLVVILQSEMRNQILAAHPAESILELHQLNKDVVLGI